jgi:glycosyltransferase involved in cell wall biosynthesis
VPKVSVIIPTYNSAHYVTAAVNSVLAQTYRDLEILVIDDGSTDGTEAIMRRYDPPVCYRKQTNGGVASARNHGIAASRGRYIAFLDADDIWYPHKLERQLAELANRGRSHRACYTAFSVVSEDLQPLGIYRSLPPAPGVKALLTRGNLVGTPSTVLAERSLFQSNEGFDPMLSQCADWDMWVRLARLTDFLYIDEPLVYYRQHEGNMSRNVSLLEKDSLRVLEKGFASAELPADVRAIRRKALARNYTVLAGSYFRARSYFDWVRCTLHALTLDPRQFGYMLAFPARVLKRAMAGASARRG